MELIKPNPHAPQVRFIRRNGRVIPLISGNRAGVKPRVATRIVRDQVEAMSQAVEVAEKGQRVHLGYGTSHEVRGFGSSFPKFYGELGFRNKADFRKVLNTPGARQFRLMDQAVRDIKAGHSYGTGLPNQSRRFELATRQVFDNTNVVFRKIDGKVRPLRLKGARGSQVTRDSSSWMDFMG